MLAILKIFSFNTKGYHGVSTLDIEPFGILGDVEVVYVKCALAYHEFLYTTGTDGDSLIVLIVDSVATYNDGISDTNTSHDSNDTALIAHTEGNVCLALVDAMAIGIDDESNILFSCFTAGIKEQTIDSAPHGI
jgi:hypothetical protein